MSPKISITKDRAVNVRYIYLERPFSKIQSCILTHKASSGDATLDRCQHLFVHPVPGVVVGVGRLVPGPALVPVHVDCYLFTFTALVVGTPGIQGDV